MVPGTRLTSFAVVTQMYPCVVQPSTIRDAALPVLPVTSPSTWYSLPAGQMFVGVDVAVMLPMVVVPLPEDHVIT
jgi:hypothetical protein